MRLIATFVVTTGLLLCSAAGQAQNAPSNARLLPPVTGAGTSYDASAPATFPLTTYDDRQQSVFIVDEPTASARALPTVMPAPTGNIRLVSALDPIPSFNAPSFTAPASNQPVVSPAQQFQLLDDPKPSGIAPISYNTMEGPCLAPGEYCPDGIGYADEPWSFQVLPQGLIWHSYLAGPKEPRFNALLVGGQNVGEKFDGQVGGRVGLLRYGDDADFHPQGLQVDVEGGGIIEEDELKAQLVDGFDFRVGVPITFGWGNWMMKVSWYHTSAHLGDEFILANPGFPRINYSRNAIVWGLGYYLPHDVRIYGEVDYGYWTDGGNLPWAFQFGFEYSPDVRALHGAPFLAVNAFLRQENNYGGYFDFETGWQWRGLRAGQLIRAGFLYQNGPETLNEFFKFNQQQLGGGLWYDF